MACVSFYLAVALIAAARKGEGAPTPQELNEVRFANSNDFLRGTFDIYLAGGPDSGSCYAATPTDVKGPFHIEPEKMPELFPNEQVACSFASSCSQCNEEHRYSSGIRLKLSGTVKSAATCKPLDGATVEIWQADPHGVYWDKANVWGVRRAMEESDEKPYYNCRAFTQAVGGNYTFTSILPGHYIAGSAWRPRHIHAKVSHPSYTTIVTQLYFHGDRFLGDADTACPSCKSDHPDLISYLTCGESDDAFSLASLETASDTKVGNCVVTKNGTEAPTGITSSPTPHSGANPTSSPLIMFAGAPATLLFMMITAH